MILISSWINKYIRKPRKCSLTRVKGRIVFTLENSPGNSKLYKLKSVMR